MTNTRARAIAVGIVKDICGRRGLRQAWEDIDEDVQQEIIAGWVLIIVATGEPTTPEGA